MTAPALPPSGDAAWYAHYVWLDEQHRRMRAEVPTGNPTGNAPPTGLDLFCRTKGGRELLAARSTTETTPYQPGLFSQKIGVVFVSGGSVNVNSLAFAGVALGTATAVSLASTNLYTRSSRVRYVSAATASAGAGYRSTAGQVYRADGFFLAVRFGIGQGVATNRLFVGLRGTTATMSLTAETSAELNVIGVGCDSNQTTLRLFHNDGAGVAIATDLGVNFPTNTASVDLYELTLYCAPDSVDVQWSVERVVEAGARPTATKYASGTITGTEMPATTLVLSAHLHLGNAATAAAVGLDFQYVYIETDI